MELEPSEPADGRLTFMLYAIRGPRRVLSVINERALKLSPNPCRVTNSSRALAGLRRRDLVKGYYGATGSLLPA